MSKRLDVLTLRLTPEEKAWVRQQAEAAYTEMASWGRARVMAGFKGSEPATLAGSLSHYRPVPYEFADLIDYLMKDCGITGEHIRGNESFLMDCALYKKDMKDVASEMAGRE